MTMMTMTEAENGDSMATEVEPPAAEVTEPAPPASPAPHMAAALDMVWKAPRKFEPLTQFKIRERIQATLRRVLDSRLYERVERLEPGWYVVRSSSTATAYVIKGPPRWQHTWELACECTNRPGRDTPICQHRAAVLVARWRAQGYSVLAGADGRVMVAQDAADLAAPKGKYPAEIDVDPNAELT
jgi:hypothetical protein